MSEAVIRERLLNDERVLKRLTKRLFSPQKQDEHDGICIDLEIMRIHAIKQCKAEIIHENECLYYQNIISSLNTEISTLTTDISELKAQLKEELLVKENKDKYDSIAKKINKLQNHQEYTETTLAINKEIENVAKIERNIQTCIECSAIDIYKLIEQIKDVKSNVDTQISNLENNK